MQSNNINNSQNKIKFLFRKSRYILSVLIIAILLTSLVIDRLKERKKLKETPFAPTVIPTPKIDTSYESEFNIEFSLTTDSLELPETLPIYSLDNNPLSETLIRGVVENIGIKTDPFINEDPVFGKTYLYYSENGRLRIIPSTRIIDYKIYDESETYFVDIPDDEVLRDLSLGFLVDNGFIDDESSVEIYKIRSLNVDPYGHFIESSQVNIASVSFVKKVDGYPILAPTHETGIINVNINSNLEVISVYFDDVFDISSYQDYPTLSVEEIKANAKIGSSLKSLDNGKINLLYTEPNEVVSVNVNSIEIAYIQEIDENQQYLQPVYLLNGTAKLNTGSDVTVTLYLPAIKNLQD